MDELKLIKLISEKFSNSKHSEVLKGIGDDCAIIKIENSTFLLTVDSLVENIHFKKEWLNPHQLGIRAMAINLSDIAAMGGTPLFALLAITTGLYEYDEIQAIMEGIDWASNQYDVDIIGGNISSSQQLNLTITLIGKATNPIMRRGAKPGDVIMVTGTIGDASAGLNQLLQGKKNIASLIEKFINPIPRIKEGILISNYATSMIDISDGLQLDLWRLTKSSRVGAVIDVNAIPRSNDFLKFIKHFPTEKEKVFWGGEDYELLFTIPRASVEYLINKWQFNTQLTIIGEIISEESLFIKENNKISMVPNPSGWIHQ